MEVDDIASSPVPTKIMPTLRHTKSEENLKHETTSLSAFSVCGGCYDDVDPDWSQEDDEISQQVSDCRFFASNPGFVYLLYCAMICKGSLDLIISTFVARRVRVALTTNESLQNIISIPILFRPFPLHEYNGRDISVHNPDRDISWETRIWRLKTMQAVKSAGCAFRLCLRNNRPYRSDRPDYVKGLAPVD